MTRTKILAIEAAIGGGSIALLDNDHVLAKWHSVENVSRSEQLLQQISNLIDEAGIDLRELSWIAVSNGPGSYTGIRIGLSTAMGLADSLDIPCKGVSALKAIAMSSQTASAKMVIVPLGRNGFCWQVFQNGEESGTVNTGDLTALASDGLSLDPDVQVLAHPDAYLLLSSLGSFKSGDRVVIDAGRDVAVQVGIASRFFDEGLQPFYARDTPIPTPREQV